jgi:hypothetical protein
MGINMLLPLALLLATTGCKEVATAPKVEKELKEVTATGDLAGNLITEEIVCDGRSFLFQLPLFKGAKEAVAILENDIFKLIVSDFIDLTYKQGTPTKDVYAIFLDRRKEKLCNNPNEGMQNIILKHLSENEYFVSYEIAYTQNNITSSLISSYRKKGMKPVYLQELIRPGKERDVQTIYDINLQSGVASIALEVHTEDQDFFQRFLKDNVYTFEPESFQTLVPGLRKNVDGEISLQVAKQIVLPSRLSYINNMIVLDIPATELNTYLDFSKVR